MRFAGRMLCWGLLTAARLFGAAHDFGSPNLIRYDARCLTLNGQDVFISSVPFDYAGVELKLWRERLRQVKSEGFNAVSASASDLSALPQWLHLVHDEFGLYSIVRSNGNWAAVASVVGAEQITHRLGRPGGTILLELPQGRDLKAEYRAATAAGIDVPLFALGAPLVRDSDDPDLGKIFDALPLDGRSPADQAIAQQMAALESAQPDAPVLVERSPALSDPPRELMQALMAIQDGATILSLNWSQAALPDAIRLNRMLAQSGPDLARSYPLTIQAQTGSPEVTLVVRRSRGGATYLFLLNHSTTAARRGRASLWLDRDGVEFGVDYGLPPLTGRVMRLPPHSTDTSQVEQLLGE